MKERAFLGSSQAQGKVEAYPTKAEAWREGCKAYVPLFCLSDFFTDPPPPISQKLGHLQSPASIHTVLHLGGLLPISEL